MPIRAVLCDLDNTLIDFMRIKRTCCEAAVDAMIAHGLTLSHDAAIKLLYDIYAEMGIEYDKVFQEFLHRANNGIDYRILAAGIVAYRRAQLPLLATYPQVVPTLKKLRSRKVLLAVVTDAPRLKAWMRLTELGIADHFDAVVTFDDTGELKPSSLPFEKALRALKTKPEETLMVGDNIDRDVEGARRIGMRSCFARYGWSRNEKAPKVSGADHDIMSFDELLRIVLGG